MDAVHAGPVGIGGRLFQHTRPVSWPVLGLAIVVYTVACVLVSSVLFQGRIGQSLGSIYRETGFLIQSTLVGGIVSFLLTGIVIFRIGHCRAADVGWTGRAAITGVLVILAFWLVMQVILVIVAAIQQHVTFNAAWQSDGTYVVGGVLGQLLGNALVEETVCRGFLLSQFYIKAASRYRHRTALAIAVIGSSVVYSLTHYPNLVLIKHMAGLDLWGFLGGLVGLGTLFALVYVVTGNLFIAVGIHALCNTPAAMVDLPEVTVGTVWFGMTVVMLIVWGQTKRLRVHHVANERTMNAGSN